ncbi:hypothetical protein DW1_1024 [Proteiniborus sp. DW1]|uniref:hypothetical protein n=1 Tax=Proteiniborus sp. DW1 TaxID=1889883 RepID=UPI00092DFFFD|nr:hypothetical protein [Proteiniborus sp. DW1]SCG82623.1 hypothetical protein DW1_1024 [Proteiniborus sp. DW1]
MTDTKNTKNIKDIEGKLCELCSTFINLFDKLQAKGIISQEEYNIHTMVKIDFLNKFCKNSTD